MTRSIPRKSSAQIQKEVSRVIGRLAQQFPELSAEEIERAVQSPSELGLCLRLDLDLFERLEVYVRGYCDLSRPPQAWHRSAPW